MGGGFGGKETQGNLFAAVAAVAAKKTGRAVKIRPDRDDDMIVTGKRHDFVVDYEVGFDDEGRIQRRRLTYARALRLLRRPVRAGHRPRAVPLPTTPISTRRCALRSLPLKTNTVSNTAFRGFGGPQGMVGDRARDRGDRLRRRQGPARDPQAEFLRRRATATSRPTTRRSRTTSSSRIVAELEASSDYQRRRARDPRLQREQPRSSSAGIALTPVKFGISFTATHSTRPARWCTSIPTARSI